MDAVSQNLQNDQLIDHWLNNKLPAVLAGDIAAAAISASLISPAITAIDRFVHVVPKSGLYGLTL
jgi:hypothetical protein